MIGCFEILAFLHGAFSSSPSICGDTNITPLTEPGSHLVVAKKKKKRLSFPRMTEELHFFVTLPWADLLDYLVAAKIVSTYQI